MEEEEDTLPPFWLQDGAAEDGRRLRRSYSISLGSGAFLIFLMVIALALVFIIAPAFHTFTSHIPKPQSVKKSWDSLNLVLVLFAIICGFLSRSNGSNTGETPRSYQGQTFAESPKQSTETPRHWYEYSDRTPSYNRLRSFNSYPDLRLESPWIEERWRFYDDTHVNRYRERRQPEAGEEEEEEQSMIKNVEVDTFAVRTKEVPSAPPIPAEEKPSQPPPPPPSPPLRSKDQRRNTRTIEKQRNKDSGGESLKPRPSTPRAPPPPPPMPAVQNKNRRGSATKEFLTSLKGKKKKQRQRSVENFESILNSEPPPALPSGQPPPPPPPPPPPSVIQNLFYSKKSKHKKAHSVSSKTKPHFVATTKSNHKPRLRENFYALEENVVSGNESPLIPIPPPPPPPPFNLPVWKFKVQGDFVRIDSISSSNDDEAVDSSSPTSPSAAHGGGGEPETMLFYPSPGVDAKADTFIEKFRAGLKKERMNSTIGRSNLGAASPYLGRAN